jgi:hypothetical protein
MFEIVIERRSQNVVIMMSEKQDELNVSEWPRRTKLQNTKLGVIEMKMTLQYKLFKNKIPPNQYDKAVP